MLTVQDLTVRFPSRFGEFTAIKDVSLSVAPGEIHGLVGESGAGKSTIGAAVIGLLQSPGYIAAGRMTLDETDLRKLNVEQAHKMRGKRISMIFQDPQTSLNPLMTVQDQLVETIRAHEDVSKSQACKRAIDLLEEIGIKDAATRIKAYPHQFSGGMRQRVVIALALCIDPDLIIADEPTTALDVAVQSQVLGLIRRLADTHKIGFLLITHDIGVIAQVADRVTVLRQGTVMETGETAQVLGKPTNPYTVDLMKAVPPLDRRLDRFLVPGEQLNSVAEMGQTKGAKAEQWLLAGRKGPPTGLTIRDLSVRFVGERSSLWRKPKPFIALNDVSLDVRPGTIMGLVGESGSGKSTLAKAITGLVKPALGNIRLQDLDLPHGRERGGNHPSRRLIQMVFQDPFSSLNARHRIGYILGDPLRHYGFEPDKKSRRALVAEMLELVGLTPDAIDKYPHQFSGGQRQRIAVARALLARPKFLICDEPTSALDVSIQAQILNLLKDLQATFGLTILFISHNLAVVRQMADDVTVLRNGAVVETGAVEDVFERPSAAYTKELLALTPVTPSEW
jgi:peptide/nickel transport system ATP-binding protein